LGAADKWKLSNRVMYVTALLRSWGFYNPRLASYRPGPGNLTGWYRIEAQRDRYRVVVTELLSDGAIKKYSYTLLIDDKPILRYDNAPHHAEVATFPHHKHVGDRVEPLPDSSLEAFLKETRILIEQAERR